MIPADIHHQNLMRLLHPVTHLLDDTGVSEVMINGPDEIYFERGGRLERAPTRFDSPEALRAAVTAMAQYAGVHVDAERPILEGRLPDGSRVEAVLPPAAPAGPMVAIRRFRSVQLTPQAMVASGFMSSAVAQLLCDAVRARQNILVSGGTGSGKTTLLNVLAAFIEPDERVIVIEDARELQLQKDHVVQLEARPGDLRGRGRVTIRDLFRASLRLRPDRIVVGELRAGEALELVQAMTSGHGGSLSTIHASHPRDALSRLETLCLMSDVDLPLMAIRTQIASAVDLVVQTDRGRAGRRISQVARVTGGEHGYAITPLSGVDDRAEPHGGLHA